MLGRTDRRLRIVVLLIVFAAFGVASIARLGYWQIARGQELQQQATSELERPVQEPAIRGNIYDRNGVVLATTAFRDTLSAYPDQISDAVRQKVVDALTPILQLDARAQSDLLARLAVPDSHYLVVDHEISEAQSTAVRNVIAAQNLPGLVLEPHAVRLYPNPGARPAPRSRAN